jgi:hypothetical protein
LFCISVLLFFSEVFNIMVTSSLVLSIFNLNSFISLFMVFFFLTLVFIQGFYGFSYLFPCFPIFFIFVVLEFLECLLYILVDHIQCNLCEILIDYLQDFFFQIVLVGFVGFLGIVSLSLAGV